MQLELDWQLPEPPLTDSVHRTDAPDAWELAGGGFTTMLVVAPVLVNRKAYLSRGYFLPQVVEGMNSNILVTQSRAYGLRDKEYLHLNVLTCKLSEI